MIGASGTPIGSLLKAAALCFCLALGGCIELFPSFGGGDDEPEPDAGMACLAPLPRDCQMTFPAEYDMIFDNVLGKTCGSSSTGASCHGPEGGQGDLSLHDRNGAYDALLGLNGNPTRVVPNDPECSPLVHRLESNVSSERMPPGPSPLSEAQRCAIIKWIDKGAPRNP